MKEKSLWTLQEIRQAYSEILEAYNVLFPLWCEGRKEEGMAPDTFDPPEDRVAFVRESKEILSKLREGADHSGNAQTWHIGEPTNGLSHGMKQRINKALKFGI